jgi:hypothetical protein
MRHRAAFAETKPARARRFDDFPRREGGEGLVSSTLARPFVRRALTRLVFISSLLVFAPAARGEEMVRCPAVDGSTPRLAEIDARQRLAFVRQVMDDQARRARTWSLAWAVTGLGLAAGNYTLAALADTRDARIEGIVGGTASLFIPGGILVQPL